MNTNAIREFVGSGSTVQTEYLRWSILAFWELQKKTQSVERLQSEGTPSVESWSARNRLHIQKDNLIVFEIAAKRNQLSPKVCLLSPIGDVFRLLDHQTVINQEPEVAQRNDPKPTSI